MEEKDAFSAGLVMERQKGRGRGREGEEKTRWTTWGLERSIASFSKAKQAVCVCRVFRVLFASDEVTDDPLRPSLKFGLQLRKQQTKSREEKTKHREKRRKDRQKAIWTKQMASKLLLSFLLSSILFWFCILLSLSLSLSLSLALHSMKPRMHGSSSIRADQSGQRYSHIDRRKRRSKRRMVSSMMLSTL